MWHTMTLEQVFASCQVLYNYSTDAVEAQNLNLTWEFIMSNIEPDLQAAVMAEVTPHLSRSASIAQSGPMAFWIIANSDCAHH